MDNNILARRFIILFVILAGLIIACFVRLFDLQVVKGSGYKEQAEQRLIRAYSVKAPRGEIVDKNGKPLVANRMGYIVQFQKIDTTDAELNETIYKAVKLVRAYDGEINTDFPIIYNEKEKVPAYDFGLDESIMKNDEKNRKKDNKNKSSAAEEKEASSDDESEVDLDVEKSIVEKQNQMMTEWEAENKLNGYGTLREIVQHFREKYKVDEKYTEQEALDIISVRYAMASGNFSANNPYALASDVSEETVQQVEERSAEFPGINIEVEPIRYYAEGSMAAHILGRTGKIYAEEYQELREKGYGMNDIIGKDGLEKVLEDYLKGVDGYKSVEMSRAGGATQILESQPAKSGKKAILTLDAELQKAMEASLQKNITTAVNRSGAGAAIAVDVKSGGVLAMASYPSYDPATFNEKYSELLKAKSNPLFNRTLSGTYSPGSTFKPLTAITGLEEGIIDPKSIIVDRGKYTYYDSYQPTCLIYSSTGATHGAINVSEAIGVSCNYFFYDLGRQVGIEKLAEYAGYFGLGKNTGIELPENTGMMASPENREANGGIWYPGDVLQAAIGQSDEMFTPAQLASYITTVLNRGKRYGLHLVDRVEDYETKETILKKEPEVLDEHEISEENYQAVKDGMRRVVTSGTAKGAFASAKYKVGGKTGTAQVSDGADNVLFVGFAPYEDPEIVVAVVIEHGANSHFAASVARETFDAYMKIKNPEPTDKKTDDDDNDTEEDDA